MRYAPCDDDTDIWSGAAHRRLPGAAQTQILEQLAYLAAQGALSIVAHGPSERRAAFVGRVWRKDGALNVEYLARLLIADEEIAQWRR